jgi:ABC-2 type transport system permease protein
MLHDKPMLFWMLGFPLLMSMFFFLAFANLMDEQETPFEKIDIAVVNISESSQSFLDAAEASDMFNIQKLTETEAEKLLSDGKITAVIDAENDYSITTAKSGTNESVVKLFADKYLQTESALNDIIAGNPSLMQSGYLDSIDTDGEYITENSLNGNSDPFVVYFYALIGMTCIMSCTMSVDVIEDIQANQSSVAARNCSAPVHKMIAFIGSAAATVLFHFVSTMIAVIFMWKVLDIQFSDIGRIALICFVGSFAGIMLGTLLSSVMKIKPTAKTGFFIGFSVFGSFLSGMMNTHIKYIVDTSVPVLKYINPVNLVTDGLYSLYYYSTPERYNQNIIILIIMGVICAIGTYLVLRRQKYANL